MLAKLFKIFLTYSNTGSEKGTYLGDVRKLTQGGPDGQWSDGNSPSNSFRFKK